MPADSVGAGGEREVWVLRVGVDFGTSSTVGMLQRADGAVTPLLCESSPLLPSAVFAGTDAALLTGGDAQRAAVAYPAGLEPNPKRRVDDGSTWLGEREFAVVDLVAAVLGREWAEARRVAGIAPAEVVLTHPASWASSRLGLLADAAGRAGMPVPRFVPEPVAAAAYFASILGREMPPGRALVVYDLGAGTFDVGVVRRSPAGFEVVGTDGLAEVGGLDLDGVVVGLAREATGPSAEEWGRLEWPRDGADQRARRELWQGARAVKELLSRHSRAELHVPLLDTEVLVTREEFEQAARPLLDRTVATTLAVLRASGTPRDSTAGVLLVGGSSRTPLAATLLHRALGIAPTALDQPELVVAHGCLHVPPTPTAPPPPAYPPPLLAPTSPPIPMSPAIPFPTSPQAPFPVSPPAPFSVSPPAPGPVSPSAPNPMPPPVAGPPPVSGAPWGAPGAPAGPHPGPSTGAPPMGSAWGAPVPGVASQPMGVLPASFPIQLVELSLPDETGYTLRTYLSDLTAVYASVEGRLPLFRRAEHAIGFAVNGGSAALSRLPHWEPLRAGLVTSLLELTEDHRYGLDLVLLNLARSPAEWLPELLLRAGDVAWELVDDLDLDAGHRLIAEGGLLDRLDTLVRAVHYGPHRRQARRDLLTLPGPQVAAAWRDLTGVLAAHIDWRD